MAKEMKDKAGSQLNAEMRSSDLIWDSFPIPKPEMTKLGLKVVKCRNTNNFFKIIN